MGNTCCEGSASLARAEHQLQLFPLPACEPRMHACRTCRITTYCCDAAGDATLSLRPASRHERHCPATTPADQRHPNQLKKHSSYNGELVMMSGIHACGFPSCVPKRWIHQQASGLLQAERWSRTMCSSCVVQKTRCIGCVRKALLTTQSPCTRVRSSVVTLLRPEASRGLQTDPALNACLLRTRYKRRQHEASAATS